MNPNTGDVFRGDKEIFEALARGEQVVPVSEDVATAVEIGMRKLRKQRGEKPRGKRAPKMNGKNKSRKKQRAARGAR